METFSLKYAAAKDIKQRAHIGVVGSGDLEVILEPSDANEISFNIRTSADGFQPTWEKVIKRFVDEYNVKGIVTINDFGATPGVVRLRLAQTIEVAGI